MTKALTRKMLRLRLKEASEQQKAEESAMICTRLLGIDSLNNARTVLLYSSMSSEVDTKEIISKLAVQGKRIVLPVVREDFSLSLREYDSESLREGYMDIAEPDEKCLPVDEREIDFAVIPGLGFDRSGHRIGRGKGCYDRLLPLLRPDCVTAGLAFSFQMLEEIPVEPHDVVLDIIVTAD